MLIGGGQPKAYLRGRKLKGIEVKLPEGYKGVVVKGATKSQAEDRATGRTGVDNDDPEIANKEVETSNLDEVADFGEVVIWGHEAITEPDDVFFKGVNEWVTFATAVSKRCSAKHRVPLNREM